MVSMPQRKQVTKAILPESKQQSSTVVSAKEPAAKELAATVLKEISEVRIQKRPMSFTPNSEASACRRTRTL